MDRLILQGVSFRTIAHQFDVSVDAIKRHRKNGHIDELLIKVIETEELNKAEDLLDQVKALKRKAVGILDEAEASRELSTALSAIREIRGILELWAKIEGRLHERSVQQINIFTNPQFMVLQNILLKELGPYPKARIMIVEAIQNALRDSSRS